MISLLLSRLPAERGRTPEGDHLGTDAELMRLLADPVRRARTTTNLLCNALVALAGPRRAGRLREDPSLVNRAVEEVLGSRPNQDHHPLGLAATTARQAVKAGTGVLVQQSPTATADVRRPGRFDIGRATQPLQRRFGRGIHACLGAQLARIEARWPCRDPRRLGGVRVLGESPGGRTSRPRRHGVRVRHG